MITLTTIVAPAKPRPEKTYRIRKDAEAAAVMAIGPHARKGFEFEAFKCDGAWRWREFDEVRPPNAAELKASGGKKSILAAAAMTGTAMAKTTDSGAIVPATYDELKASGGLRSAPVPKGDGLDLPPVLKRVRQPKSPQVIDIVDGPVPAAAWEAPQKPQDAPKKAKATRTAPKPAKRATEAPTQMAVASKGQSKTAMVGELLIRAEGCTTADILALTGWPSVSVPAQAKAVGLNLRKVKDGKTTRYFGSR